MTNPLPTIDLCFTAFDGLIKEEFLPTKFTLLANQKPHPLCERAAQYLQNYLESQKDWNHNFGLIKEKEGAIIGKMFGVLVVKTIRNQIGYLWAFSGKLAGSNHHPKFVPPVFDMLTENSFLNKGMVELARMGEEIKKLESLKTNDCKEQMIDLKIKRKNYSKNLQKEIFEHYHFLNQGGESKSLTEIFNHAGYKNPPSGAGECAAPKLLQYAFLQKMKPLALAEFWWGLSPKSEHWKHGEFYPCCHEKCQPIFAHTLKEMEINYDL